MRADMPTTKPVKARDATLGICARNMWLLYSLFNIYIHVDYVPGKANMTADLLSRHKFYHQSWDLLKIHVPNVAWVLTHANLTCVIFFTFISEFLSCHSPGDHQRVCLGQYVPGTQNDPLFAIF